MAMLVINLIQTLSNAKNMVKNGGRGFKSFALPGPFFMVNGGCGSSPFPYHAPFMVYGMCGSSHLPYHAPFMVNGGRGSSPLTYPAPFMVNDERGSSPLTYHAPFMVNGGRGSSPLPMPRPFYDVNQCNKKNISNDLYCCFFCLICFYMTIDYYYYLF